MGGSRLTGHGSGGSGTMARIVGHLSVAELEARYRAARDVTEARHAQAIWLLAQGRTVLEVAAVLAFAPRWVTRLAARYNASGPAALGDRRRRNVKAASLLTPDLLAALAERVRTPPEDGGLWSGPKAAAWMAAHLGLKPVRRRVWAPVGQRPIALGHHRYKWLHVIAFVQPTSGEAVWFLSTGLSKPFFEALLAAFARETGAGRERHIVLVLDDAGWHGPKDRAVPEGIGLVFLPPYTPELQPAEHLWPLVDEAVVNKRFAGLDAPDAAVAARCRRLDPATVRPHTDFHWWPRPTTPN